MIKPKECPKGGGQGGRTRVLTPLHLPLSFRVHCSQQCLFQIPGVGVGVASPLGLLHVARRGHPQGSTPGWGGARSARAVLLAPHPFFFPQFGLPSTVLLSLSLRLAAHLCFFFSFLFTHRWMNGWGLSSGGCRSELLFGSWVETEWGVSLGTQLGGSFRWSRTGERSKEIHSSGKQIEKASVAGAAISLQGGGSRKMELGKSPDGVCALQ